MTDCPSADIFERLLHDLLGERERTRVEQHVDKCPICQETLRRLATSCPDTVDARLLAPRSATGLAPEFASTVAASFLHRLKRTVRTAVQNDRQRLGGRLGGTGAGPDIEGYEVFEELGRGATGVVYRAHHRELDRLVALKMIIMGGPHLAAETRQRFRVEAQAIARLRHPNIVQVYDVGEHDGCPYLSLELVQGQNLARWLAGSPRPAVEAARIVATLADAIHYAHGQGVIHRDLKPANILVSAAAAAGETPSSFAGGKRPTADHALVVKITDFGIAKVLPAPGATEAAMTLSGAILGTPAYAAPEQAQGKLGDVGPGADVYALGAILYELLTGRPSFQGPSPMATLWQVAHQEPVPPARLVPRVPRDLNTICLKCLEKDPARRYATAGELAADLLRFLNHEPIHARPITPLERAIRWVRRRPGRAATVAAGVVVAAGLAAGGLELLRQRAVMVHDVENDLREVTHREERFSWARARTVLDDARDRLGAGGPAELHQRLAQAGRDLDLVMRLDAIRLNRPRADRSGLTYVYPDGGYEDAFRTAGLGAVGDDPKQVAAKISSSAARAPILEALDDWAVCATSDRRGWIFEVARAVDPNAWRDRVRNATAWDDPSALLDVTKAAPEDEPVELLVAAGERLREISRDPGESLKAVEFLKGVQRVQPDDFWANFVLGFAMESASPAEAISYNRAALAIRPHTAPPHYNLGVALQGNGQAAEATYQYAKAAAIDPNYGQDPPQAPRTMASKVPDRSTPG